MSEKGGTDFLKSLSLVGFIGFVVAFTVGLSFALGYLIDSWLGTSPLFTLIIIFLGTFSAFWKIYQKVIREYEE